VNQRTIKDAGSVSARSESWDLEHVDLVREAGDDEGRGTATVCKIVGRLRAAFAGVVRTVAVTPQAAKSLAMSIMGSMCP